MQPPHTIILIDDDPISNYVSKNMIEYVLPNAEIIEFTLPEKGLKYIFDAYSSNIEHHPTILFLDINMPVLDGWGFLEKFAQLDESIKDVFDVYILSSSLNHSDKERALSIPRVKRYLSKPITSELLKQLF